MRVQGRGWGRCRGQMAEGPPAQPLIRPRELPLLRPQCGGNASTFEEYPGEQGGPGRVAPVQAPGGAAWVREQVLIRALGRRRQLMDEALGPSAGTALPH